MNSLPKDILFYVCQWMSPISIARLSGISKRYNEILKNHPRVNKWRHIIEEANVEDGFTAAVTEESIEMMDFMVDLGAVDSELGMYEAGKIGSEVMVLELIKRGNTSLHSALRGACKRGHYRLAQMILNDLRRYCPYFDDERAPMHEACQSGDLKMVNLIVSRYPEVYKSNLKSGFLGACRGGNRDVVDFMLKKSKAQHLTTSTRVLNQGFRIACEKGHVELVRYLVSIGADDYNEALFHGCKSGNQELIDYLVSLGANNWNRALAGACKGGHLYLVKKFVDRGAKVTNECIINALDEHKYEIVEYLAGILKGVSWIRVGERKKK